MLKRFEVENYRGFHGRYVLDLTTTHDYRFHSSCVCDGIVTTGMVYGRNARGKTNLGRAIMDIRENLTRLDDVSQPLDMETFANADAPGELVQFRYLIGLSSGEVEYEYAKHEDKSLAWERMRCDGEVLFDYDFDKGIMRGRGSRLPQTDILPGANDGEVSLLSYYSNSFPLPDESPLLQLRRFVAGMHMSNARQDMSALMKMIAADGEATAKGLEVFLAEMGIEESLVVSGVSSRDRELYSRHGDALVPFMSIASAGTRDLVRYYAAVESQWAKRTFVYLDEFDAAYHFELAESLVRHISQSDVAQTIITSHNTALIGNKILRPDCYFILGRDGITALPEATDRELREGHNLEKLYKAGEFDRNGRA